eukprot:CAMPEP_0172913578 /NCGR_PEP_ID=MMETSP1075-20121228/190656_1 /TAXON_ID=2916 /ORGANISM="Ceratium fusus, Strain PA161109" /LENGTH=264 /DNA_ID=CAMNT_0013772315 /DNA_START=62 /DNA_END=853 /DNA_ORIENTATION=+
MIDTDVARFAAISTGNRRGMSEPLLAGGNRPRAFCTVLEPCVRELDRAVLLFLQRNVRGLPEQVPPELAREIRRLRLPFVMQSVIMIAFALQVVATIDGWRVLASTGALPSCKQLNFWLLTFCAVNTILNSFTFVTGPPFFMLVWAVYGLFLAAGVSGLLLWGMLVLLVVRWRVRHIRRLWGNRGQTAAQVIAHILAAARPDVAPDTECPICLAEGTDWCSLVCGHVFHEQCLLGWLRRARQCPLCRLNVHFAYLPDSAVDVVA